MLSGIGPMELLVIFLLILLLFGAKRIPEMAQGMGKGIKEFKKAMRDVQTEIDVSAPTSHSPNTIAPTPPANQVAYQYPNQVPQQAPPAQVIYQTAPPANQAPQQAAPADKKAPPATPAA